MNFENVIQSIIDTWLPVFGVAVVALMLFLLVRFLKKRRER